MLNVVNERLQKLFLAIVFCLVTPVLAAQPLPVVASFRSWPIWCVKSEARTLR